MTGPAGTEPVLGSRVVGIRANVLFEISRRLVSPPPARTADMDAYKDWRTESLSASWSRFDDAHVRGKDVVDFGSGKGDLTLFLGAKAPRRIVGVELHGPSVEESRARASERSFPAGTVVEFLEGREDGMPLPDASFDALLAFDCVEHIMRPEELFREWHRVLRPGGRALIEWFPYSGPWGPHMESLIPVPWAHHVFGEKAMMRAAERVYDSKEYVHRPWDLKEDGSVAPNKWRQWSSFQDQGYINKLSVRDFLRMVEHVGFRVDRFEPYGFISSPAKRAVSEVLMKLPTLRDYFTSFVIVELVR